MFHVSGSEPSRKHTLMFDKVSGQPSVTEISLCWIKEEHIIFYFDEKEEHIIVNVSDENCVLIHKSFDQVRCEHRIIRYFIYFLSKIT